MDYTIVDIETTGLSEHAHAITEIAAVRLHDGKVVQQFHSLINPNVRIPSFITRLTGIDNEMVKDAPQIHEVMPSFVNFLGDSVFVAHNASFDFRFLSHASQQHCNCVLSNRKLCTRKLANRLLPELSTKRLDYICDHFNIVNIQAHRAMADVHATMAVFEKFMLLLKARNMHTLDDILKFERMPKRMCVALPVCTQ